MQCVRSDLRHGFCIAIVSMYYMHLMSGRGALRSDRVGRSGREAYLGKACVGSCAAHQG